MSPTLDASSNPVPATRMLHSLRPSFNKLVNALWQINLYGADRVPNSGPVIFAANHIGWLDGPLLAIVSPRPAHVLTKREMYKGPVSTFLTRSGQIPLNRIDVDIQAIRDASTVLEQGGVVGIFPEGVRGGGDVQRAKGGAAYLALRTGATVVPVAFLGTRSPGQAKGQIPPRGTRIAVGYGHPVEFSSRPWPRRKQEVTLATQRVKQALVETVAFARSESGLDLPGPLTEVDND